VWPAVRGLLCRGLLRRCLLSVACFPWPAFRGLLSVACFPWPAFRGLLSVAYFPWPAFRGLLSVACCPWPISIQAEAERRNCSHLLDAISMCLRGVNHLLIQGVFGDRTFLDDLELFLQGLTILCSSKALPYSRESSRIRACVSFIMLLCLSMCPRFRIRIDVTSRDMADFASATTSST
jgi:hypothetical protein